MWKREIPATPEISSRVNASARWLSINQSAFWAGFMDDSLCSKPLHYDRLADGSFDSPCSVRRKELRGLNLFLVIARSTATEHSSLCHSGAMRSIEPGISRFPDAQLRI